VTAEMRKGGSEKTDYRYLKGTGRTTRECTFL
jgi:hypothetical protein